MSVTLKPYPIYKDSGVEWLGDVPKHWDVWRLKYVFPRIIGGSTPSSTEPDYWDGDVVWITPTDVSKAAKLRNSLRKITYKGLHSCSSQLVPSGSIVVTSRAPVGNVAIAETELCTNQGCKALVVNDAVLNPMFGFHALNILKSELKSLATGTTFTEISTSRLSAVSMPIPPLPEQAAIVHFLDHYDRKIRRFIHAKQKLIKLLEEQKQAIICQAVTHGLDPNVRLKPSGVEWLGDVPEHWSLQRTKNLFRLRTEKAGNRHGMELLSIYTHIGVRPRKELEERGNKASTTDDYWIVRRGDIIVNKLLTWMGAIGMSNYEGVTSPAYDILMPTREIVPEFYHYLFRTKLYLQQFKQRSRGIMDMRLRLYFDQFGQILLLVPPVQEQSAIVAYCLDRTENLDRIIRAAQREISLIREYRTRLIADVVTGKLDVRNVPIEESEEIEELPEYEALDDESSMSEEVGELEDADN